MHRILDAKYKKADLNKVMTKQYQQLNTKELERLLNLLWKYEELFNGTLGTWNTTPVDLELRDDAKLVCSRPYPLSRIHKVIFRKEVKILVNLRALEEAN